MRFSGFSDRSADRARRRGTSDDRPDGKAGKVKAAVVYPYWPRYREAIAALMCRQTFPDPEYVLISGGEGRDGIRTIDPCRSGIPVEQGGLRWRFVKNFWAGRFFLWQTGVAGLGLSKEFDAIIYLGQFNILSTIVSALVARLAGKRVVMWTHGFIRERNDPKELIRGCFYRLAQGFLLYGDRARAIMMQKGFDPEGLHVVYNSLDYEAQKLIRCSVSEDELSRLRRAFFPHAHHHVLSFIGRLTPQKKLDMLIRAGKKLHDGGFPVNILIVGDGSERGRLETLSGECFMREFTHFFGECHDEREIAQCIMMSDVCVSPGEVGLTAMHALAYGTPVITHDDPSRQMPECEAVREGVSGCFFRYGSVDDLAWKIRNWLTENEACGKAVKENCISVIEDRYHPAAQIRVINAAVRGEEASGCRGGRTAPCERAL